METLSADARAEFTSLRDEAMLLSLSLDQHRGYLVAFFVDAPAAAAGVQRIFASEETLGAALRAIGPAVVHEYNVSAPPARPVIARDARPCAVVMRGPIASLPDQATAIATAEVFLSDVERPAEAATAPGVPESGLVVLHEWTSPDGCTARLGLIKPSLTHVRLEHEGLGEILIFEVGEVPDLIQALSRVGKSTAESPDADGTVDETARDTRERFNPYPATLANRFALARLYAVYPEGLSADEIERLSVDAGIDAGMSTGAIKRLTGSGRIVSRSGILFVKPDAAASV